ncbi:MAG: hypothetical protein QOJ50_3769, partial [Cryptosporangiaceae bacterium]|nr:hypothetical protein [Cryptosporangiaceae bacterium]
MIRNALMGKRWAKTGHLEIPRSRAVSSGAMSDLFAERVSTV